MREDLAFKNEAEKRGFSVIQPRKDGEPLAFELNETKLWKSLDGKWVCAELVPFPNGGKEYKNHRHYESLDAALNVEGFDLEYMITFIAKKKFKSLTKSEFIQMYHDHVYDVETCEESILNDFRSAYEFCN